MTQPWLLHHARRRRRAATKSTSPPRVPSGLWPWSKSQLHPPPSLLAPPESVSVSPPELPLSVLVLVLVLVPALELPEPPVVESLSVAPGSPVVVPVSDPAPAST